MDPIVYNTLQKLDLIDSEIKIYLKLLETEGATITEISRLSKIPRTTVHENIARLMSKALVTETDQDGNKIYLAESPDKLSVLLNNKKLALKSDLEQIDMLSKDLHDVVSNIQTFIPKQEYNFDISFRYYKGKNGFKQITNRSIQHDEPEIYYIANMDKFYDIYDKEYAKTFYIPDRIKKGIKLKLLCFKSDLTKNLKDHDHKNLRETRFLPEADKFVTTTMIYDKEVSIMVSSQPYLSILIENKEINQTYRKYFDYLWNISS